MTVIDTLNTRRIQFDKTNNVEYSDAIDAVAEYIAANDELIEARKVLAWETKWGIESANAAVERAEARHAAAHARMKGESK